MTGKIALSQTEVVYMSTTMTHRISIGEVLSQYIQILAAVQDLKIRYNDTNNAWGKYEVTQINM